MKLNAQMRYGKTSYYGMGIVSNLNCSRISAYYGMGFNGQMLVASPFSVFAVKGISPLQFGNLVIVRSKLCSVAPLQIGNPVILRLTSVIGEVLLANPFLRSGFKSNNPQWEFLLNGHRRGRGFSSQVVLGIRDIMFLSMSGILEPQLLYGIFRIQVISRLKPLTAAHQDRAKLRRIKAAVRNRKPTTRESLAIMLETTNPEILDLVIELMKQAEE
jgi:hypothetical protein